MNHEAFVIRLRMMRRQIAEARARALSAPSHDPASASPQAAADHAQLMQKVEGWRAQLELLTHELKRQEGLLHLRSQGRPGYSERQSISDRQRNIDTLRGAILELMGEIDGLLGDFVRGDAALKALADAFKKLVAAAKDDGQTVASFEAELARTESIVQQLPPGSGGGPGGPVVTPVTSYIIALLALLRLLRGRGPG